MKALAQTVFLAFTDLRRQLGSPHSAISFVGSIVFVGVLFWLLGPFAIDHFLNAAFLMVPILILAPATASITSDREAGYASILFTYPVTASRYYAAKFLAMYLLLGVYFLLLPPYVGIILVYGGGGWLADIGRMAGWAVLETSFVTALGLFLSASFGRRAAMASAYIGFGLALVFIIGPWFLPYYILAMPPETGSLLLRILHYSPMMAALDSTGTGSLVADNPWPALVASVAVVACLIGLGLLVYRRFQSAEGWEIRRAKAAPVVALGILILFAIPMIPPVSYTVLPEGFGNSICVQNASIEYCVGLQVALLGASPDYPSLGSPFQAEVGVSFHNERNASVSFGRVALDWSSRFFAFNVTHAEFGPATIPANDSVWVRANVTAVALRIPSLQVYSPQVYGGFSQLAPVPAELTLDATRLRFDGLSMIMVGPIYERNLAWGVLVLEAALVLGRRLARRPRKGSP